MPTGYLGQKQGKDTGSKKESQEERAGGFTVLIVGLCLVVPSLLHTGLGGFATKGMSLGGLICLGIGILSPGRSFFSSRQLPKKEVMRLAEQRKGILTLSEITTALDIEPDVARRTLQALSKEEIATQRWEEYRKNLWEFPDYMKLSITESIELAKAKGGRLTMEDLLNSGHSADITRQTLDTLGEKGLAHRDPSTSGPAMIVTTQ